MKKKDNIELKKQIKEMEDRARQEAQASSEVTIIQPDGDERISFDQWWMLIQGQAKMRPHMKEILLVDFMARGLTKKETKQKYDDTLRIFGIVLK